MKPENYVQITIALIGFLGGIVAVVGNIIIARIHREKLEGTAHSDLPPEATQSLHRELKSLARLSDLAFVAFVFSLLIIAAVLLWPGEENTWFARASKEQKEAILAQGY